LSPSAQEKGESLGAAEVEMRVKAACTIVGSDFNMTMDQVFEYIPVETVYAYAHDKGQDLTVVVKKVLQCTMAVDEGLDILSSTNKVDRVELQNLLNWFHVFDYAVQNRKPLVDVMQYALETHGAHLLKNTKQSNDGDNEEIREKLKIKPVAFDMELEHLKKARGLPDGKSDRDGQRFERQKKNRSKKLNKARGFLPGISG
jgi:hypothetical protein